MLNTLEKQTILAALRNGLGLTHACAGLHKSPKDVSEFILATPAFQLECNQATIGGYQSILLSMNDAQNKKAWEKWRTANAYIQQFITSVVLWESMGNPVGWEFIKVTMTIRKCKTLPEAATALGFEEIDFHSKLYTDEKIIHWLIQNGFNI